MCFTGDAILDDESELHTFTAINNGGRARVGDEGDETRGGMKISDLVLGTVKLILLAGDLSDKIWDCVERVGP